MPKQTNNVVKKEKGRTHGLILYSGEQLEKGLTEYIEHIKNYVFILHKAEGEQKKDHIHLLIRLKNTYATKTVIKWFSTDVDNAKDEVIDQPRQFVKYMLHQTEKSIEDGKIKYDESELKSDNLDYWLKADQDTMKLIIEDLLDGLTTWDMVNKYGRDFIIHYKNIMMVVKEIRMEGGKINDENNSGTINGINEGGEKES